MTDIMLHLPPDDALAETAASGSVDAFDALIRRHHEGCLRFATRMLRDPADAEDAVQEAFTRAFLARDRYDPRQPFRGWLFAILVNCCRTVGLQRRRRERRFASDDAALTRASVSVEPLEEDDTRHAVASLVAALDPLLREAFLLKYVEDMDYREMSAALGASPSALKMRVKRACDALRPRLRELFYDP